MGRDHRHAEFESSLRIVTAWFSAVTIGRMNYSLTTTASKARNKKYVFGKVRFVRFV